MPTEHAMFARILIVARSFALISGLTVLAAPGCNETYLEPAGCVVDEDCRSPRLCSEGRCVDPPDADATDAQDATDERDGSGDATDVVPTDVPAPRDVPPPPDAVDIGGPEIIEPPDVAPDVPSDATPDAPAPDATPDATPDVIVEGPCLRAVDAPRVVRAAVGTATTLDAAWLNCGTTPIDVLDVALALEAPSPAALDIVEQAPADGRLAPGERLEVALRFGATVEGRYTVLATPSTRSDAVEPSTWTTEVLVEADRFCPVLNPGASRSFGGPFVGNLSVVEGQTVTLDPGYPVAGASGVEFEWALEAFEGLRPPALSATPVNGRVSLTDTLLGLYTYTVAYRSVDGCDGSGRVQFRVSEETGVGEGLRVVISWRTPGDPDELEDPGSDVDLHMVRARGDRLRWNSEEDCYFGNREPEWGAPAESVDNCRLLRDELDGIGPEILVLERPARDEVWYVGAHYFAASGFGPSEVTLRVFRNGIQQVSAVRTLRRDREVWVAAEIRDEGRTIRVLDAPNYAEFPERL